MYFNESPPMKKTLLILFSLACLTGAIAQPLPTFVKDSLDRYVSKAMADWQIPGLAVGIIKDGKLVYSKGYGVREMGKSDPVDANTLFMMASNSKAMTATLLSALESEKKLSLDDKVTRWLPYFKLYDENASRLVTLRDLLCHRLGLMTFQSDFTFWGSTFTRRQIIEKLALSKPAFDFRARYGYCNAAFLTAGEVLPAVTGSSWEELIRQRIFKPLGMSRSVALNAEFPASPTRAVPHTLYDGKLVKMPFCQIDNLAPAGSTGSCVSDWSRWLIMQMDTGRFEGQQIFPKDAILRTWAGNTLMNTRKSPILPTQFSAYGLGWVLQDYAGRRLISHTGGADGFVTATCFVPDERLGVIVLTNTDTNDLYQALQFQILDAFLNLPYRNYHELFFKNALSSRAREATQLAKWRAQVAQRPATALPLSAYVGTYTHPLYGDVSVAQTPSGLRINLSQHQDTYGTLEPMGDNEFLCTYSRVLFGIHPMPFEVKDGNVKGLRLKVNDFIEYGAYDFVKKN